MVAQWNHVSLGWEFFNKRINISVVEKRDAMGDGVDIFHQPVVQFPAHTGREFADEAQGHCAREYGIIKQD